VDKYIKIAQDFYNTFEGKAFYPKFISKIWAAWFFLATLFTISILYLIYCVVTKKLVSAVVVSGVWVIVAEIAFLFVNNAIDLYKNKRQNEYFNLQPPDVKPQLKTAKRRELERLLGHKSSSFLAVAKELHELKTAKKNFDRPTVEFWSSIFQVEAKPRLIAMTLGACAITAALISRTVEDVAIFRLIESGEFYLVLFLCVWLAIIAHFFFLGARLAFQLISGKIMEWLLKLGWSKAANKIAINYLVSSLVELHEPVKKMHRPMKPFDNFRRRQSRV